MIATRFTFKKEPRETGLAGTVRPYPNTQIKLAGKTVGTIYAPNRVASDKWSVGFMVEKEPTPTNPCPFAWKTLKRRFDSEPEAREFVQSNAAELIAWGLYGHEEQE
jgi:hypothetical protein